MGGQMSECVGSANSVGSQMAVPVVRSNHMDKAQIVR